MTRVVKTMGTSTSMTRRHSTARGRGRRLATVVAAAATFAVLGVGCGEDDPTLESPGTEDTGGEQETEQGGNGEDGGLY